MDQYDSRRPQDRHRGPRDATPIYDRLLAEWQERGDTERPESAESGPPCAGGLVPAARTSGETSPG
ncbi:hypothetical protein AB0C40_23730 [Streptomyces brevispora]